MMAPLLPNLLLLSIKILFISSFVTPWESGRSDRFKDPGIPPFIPPPPPDPPGTPEEFGRASPKTWELDRKLQFTVEGGRGGEGYLNEE